MFKLDEDLQKLFNDAVEWFATPPTQSEKEAMEQMVNDTGDSDESDMFGPEGWNIFLKYIWAKIC